MRYAAQSPLDVGRELFNGVARRNAAGQIGHVRTEIGTDVLNNEGALAHRDFRSRLACLKMPASVDFESSMPSAPGTVSDPRFSACQKSDGFQIGVPGTSHQRSVR